MVISSRTPEGYPNRCPLCGNVVCVEPSRPFGDAPCPCCGHLLWFLAIGSEQLFFLAEQSDDIRERVFDRLCEELGVHRDNLPSNPASLEELGVDSLDIAELLMELDDERG